MIVRMNGIVLPIQEAAVADSDEVVLFKRSGINPKLKRLAVTLWTLSGIIMTGGHASASSGMDAVMKVWNSFAPFFGTMQGFAMVIGTLGLLAGLMVVGFKRQFGKVTIVTSIFIILGTALVPGMVMLIFFLGTVLNDAITEAMNGMTTAPTSGVKH